MALKPGDAFAFQFVTTDDAGALTDADSLPTGTIVRNGTDDATPTVTVANVSTGVYRASGTLPGTYAAGDVVQVRLNATVGAVASGGTESLGVLDSKRVGDLNDLAAGDLPPDLTSEVAAVQADMDAMQAVLVAIQGATFDPATDSLEAIRNRGDSAWTTGAGGSAPTVEEIRAEIDASSTQLAAILTQLAAIVADTGTDLPALLTTIDTIVDAIKAKTDGLTFTQAGQVDANVQRINDVALTGDGSTTPFI